MIDPDDSLGVDVLDLTCALVDQSLLVRSPSASNRLGMLETIREYASEQLAASGEDRLVGGQKFAAHFRRLAEAARNAMTDPRRDEILDELDRELPNLRAALAWSHRDWRSRDRPSDHGC